MTKVAKYVLTVDVEKCDGCRQCEMICSLVHTDGLISPAKARVNVMKKETMGVDIPMVCRHCEEPPCADVCPMNAIIRDEETGAVLIVEDKCIGCRECILACPFGAIKFDIERSKPIKCDLCIDRVKAGELPACVEWCQWGKIRYERADLMEREKRQKAMEKLARSQIESLS